MELLRFALIAAGFVAPVQGSSNSRNAENGIVSLRSEHSVDETVAKIEGLLRAKEVKLFAVIDHNGEAEKAGMTMPPTKLLIFGNPKAGTPLMLSSPTVAIDLPLKLLVWQDTNGAVWITYNSPEYLQERFHIPDDLMKNVSMIAVLAAKAAE